MHSNTLKTHANDYMFAFCPRKTTDDFSSCAIISGDYKYLRFAFSLSRLIVGSNAHNFQCVAAAKLLYLQFEIEFIKLPDVLFIFVASMLYDVFEVYIIFLLSLCILFICY